MYKFFKGSALKAALATVLMAAPCALADHHWIMTYYGDEPPEAPRAAISFLDATIPEGGVGEVWLRIPETPPVAGKIYGAQGNFVQDAETPIEAGEARHPFSVAGFAPGEYRFVLEAAGGAREAESLFRVETPLLPERNRIALLVDEPAGRDWESFPVSLGVPFPRSVLTDVGQARIVDADGREVPSQLRAAGTWDAEGRSIKWVNAVFFADSRRGEGACYYLEHGTAVRRHEEHREPVPILRVEESGERLLIDAGRLALEVNKLKGTIVEDMRLDGRPVVRQGGLYLQDQNRRVFSSAWAADPPEVILEEAGPLRAVVRQRGWYADEAGGRLCRYDVRLHVFADKPFVQVLHTWILTHDSREVQFGDISFRLETAAAMESCGFALETGADAQTFEAALAGLERVSLVQSDSDEFSVKAWPLGAEAAQTLRSGERSSGSMAVRGQGTGVVAHLRELWQQYPAELEAGPWGLAVHFWPAHGFSYEHKERASPLHRWPLSDGPFMDLQPREFVEKVLMQDTARVRGYDRINALGLAKTHEVWIRLEAEVDAGTAAGRARAQFEEMPAVRCDPEWVSATRIFRPFLPVDDEAFPVAEEAIRARWDAVDDLQERFHNYGWLHFGDHQGSPPVMEDDGTLHSSFRANRYWRAASYRAGVEPWLLWLRSGDRRYRRHAESMSRHFMDVDHIHWASDEVHPPRRPGQGYLQSLSHYNTNIVSGSSHNEPVGFSHMYYHLAGYARARDFLMDVADALYPYSVPPEDRHIHRGNMSAARQLFDIYRETWDRKYYDNAWPIVSRMLDSLIAKRLHPSHMTYMYELLYDWREKTGDSRVNPALRSLTGMYAGKPTGVDGAYPVLFDFGHMYELTGDPEYIAWGKGILQNRLYDVTVQADAPYRGRQRFADPITLTRTIRQVPGFLHYARLAEERHGPIRPRIPPIKFFNNHTSAHLLNEDGGDFSIRVFWRFLFQQEGVRVTGKARIAGTDGGVLAEADFDSEAMAPQGTPVWEQQHYADLFVRGDGRPEVYHLTVSFDEGVEEAGGFTYRFALGNPDGLKIAYDARRIAIFNGQVFFHVPPETQSFSITIPQASGYPGEPAIVDPSGNVVARAIPPHSNPLTIRVDLPEGERPETYGLVFSRRRTTVELGEDLPPYLYSDPAEFFLPPVGRARQANLMRGE